MGTNHGTLLYAAGYAAGRVGNAFSFDGLNSQIANNSPALRNIANNFTIQFWAFPTASRNATVESSSGVAGTSGQRYAIYPENPGDSAAGVGVSVGNNGISVFEHGPSYLPSPLVYGATITNWVHVAVVYTNKQPSLYLNGEWVRTGLTSPSTSVFPSKTFSDAGTYGKYAGLLDEVAIFDRALGSNEIAALYAAGSAGMCFTNDPVPVFVQQPASQTVIEARTATFTSAAMGNPRPAFQWLFNGSPVTGATNVSLALTNLTLGQGGIYAVIARNTFGSVTSAVAQLSIIEDFNLPGKSATNCTAKPAGLIAWWPGDGFAADVAGTNHGTLQNGLSFGSGKAGQAFQFDGTDDYLTVPHSGSLLLTGAVTLEAWIKSSNAPAYAGIIKKFSSDNRGFQIGLNNNGTARADFGYGSGYFTAFHSTPVLNSAWHHVAATFDGTNALVYVDGIPGPATTWIGSLASNSTPLTIGNDTCCAGRYFRGAIDEPAIYGRALETTKSLPSTLRAAQANVLRTTLRRYLCNSHKAKPDWCGTRSR